MPFMDTTTSSWSDTKIFFKYGKGACRRRPLPQAHGHCHTAAVDINSASLGACHLLTVLKPNRIIRKRTDANCSSFHLRVFLGLSNPQEQRQTSTLSIPRDNF
jgi:hypothetical protein